MSAAPKVVVPEETGPRKSNQYVFLLEGEAPGAPGLSATKCGCGKYTLGKVPVCSHCFSRKVEHVAAGQRGTLTEFAIVRHSAAGFEAPYAIGSVTTSEGLTLMTPMQGAVESLKAGMPVKFSTVAREGGVVGFAYAAA
jgi:uncharacterized OB-fold protein